jgi:hypothetical protein
MTWPLIDNQGAKRANKLLQSNMLTRRNIVTLIRQANYFISH